MADNKSHVASIFLIFESVVESARFRVKQCAHGKLVNLRCSAIESNYVCFDPTHKVWEPLWTSFI